MLNAFKSNISGVLLCLGIAVPAFCLGRYFPIVGGPVFSMLIGMLLCSFIHFPKFFDSGIKYTSKKILQYSVILLGFGLNLNEILKTGQESLPIIITTILTSLVISFVLCKTMNIPTKLCTLIGVGSSICGGSAIAATAPVIKANDEEVAQAISVVFCFNVLAALIFPTLGDLIGMTHDATAFGIFAGTAVNDTSSVTATASTWDSMFGLGHDTLDKAVTVKLTRTLAIIPITLVLSFLYANRHDISVNDQAKKLNIAKMIPSFIILFIIASVITTVCVSFGVEASTFKPLKDLSLFMIIMAMAAIGLNCNVIKLLKTGAIPIFLGLSCWVGITVVCLLLQSYLGIW